MLPHQFRDNAPCQLGSSYGTRTMPLFPRQHNSPKRKGGNENHFLGRLIGSLGGPQGERGLEFSRRKKGQTFFLSPHSLGLYNKVPKVRMLIYVHTYTQTHPHLGTVLYTFMKFKVKNTVQLI